MGGSAAIGMVRSVVCLPPTGLQRAWEPGAVPTTIPVEAAADVVSLDGSVVLIGAKREWRS
ncbi:hypothetical protein GCM10012275_50070 [Longimycelium tulufanense]|uniref:Uncharacterized protein n=1 Tax=Longimycelium tulufanense TaxID=907463 RepID=A0A8J3FWP4_9PSEU|nr:hypothetical protein GCM10012275_50070 [Longimycelium tulufanense]